MTDNKLLVIDTETGGLDVNKHSLLSLGAVVWRDGQITAEIEIIVREPIRELDPEAMAATGFDLSVVDQRGVSPIVAVTSFRSFLDKNFGPPETRSKIPVAGHNVGFDVGFCERLFRLADAKVGGLFSHRHIDTAAILGFLILAGRLPPECGTSSGAFQHFGIVFAAKERHTALADARATAILLTRLVALVAQPTVPPQAPG